GDSSRGSSTQTLRLNPNDSTQAQYITYPKDSFNRFEPAGGIGGPLVRDKAWFFGAYQPALTSTDRTVKLLSTGQPITVNQKQNVQYLTLSQTAQISDKLRTRVAYNNSWSKQTGILPNLDGSDAPGTDYTKTSTFPNWTLSGNADYIVSPKFFVGVRAGYFLNDQHDTNVPNASRFIFSNSTNIGIPGVPPELQHAVGFSSVAT